MDSKVDRQISIAGATIGTAKVIGIGCLVETAIIIGTDIMLYNLGVKSSTARRVIGSVLGFTVAADIGTPMARNVVDNATDNNLGLYQRLNPNIFKKDE